MNLQKTIRRILMEETRFGKMGEERYKSCSMSDITRMEIIDNFLKEVKTNSKYNEEEPNYDMLLDDWDGYDDQVYIQNQLDKGKIIFYEGWVDSCWSAVYEKSQYEGMDEEEVIDSIITKRFPRIAEEFNMVIDDYGYFNNGDGYIMYIVFNMSLQESIRRILREETDLYSNLKTVAFKDLPFEYQRSLIIYMYEGDVVDWSLDLDRDVVAKNDDLIKTLIKDYMSVGRNKNKSFAYGLVPMKELTKEIAERMGYDSFKDYHKDYTSDNYAPRYKKESVWPIILDVDNEELIEDGWHRFHQYYKMGLNKVPAVMLM